MRCCGMSRRRWCWTTRRARASAGDPKTVAERKVTVFSFAVTEEDRLLVEEGLGEHPQRYREPEELARHIMEILFAA